MLVRRREFVANKLEAAIADIQQHVAEAHASDNISNQALQPLQNARKRLANLTSIAEINEELRNSEYLVEQAEDIINTFIDQQAKAAERQAAKDAESQKQTEKTSQPTGDNTQGNDASGLQSNTAAYGTTKAEQPKHVAEPAIKKPKAKKIVTINTATVYQDLGNTTYLETEEELDNYLTALKTQLSDLINSNHKVRIK